MKTLRHELKKEEPIKWFLLGIIPVLNLYFLWKVAQLLSGHKKEKAHLIHRDEINSTTKWFTIIIMPLISIISLILTLSIQGGIIFYLNAIITIIISAYTLWKISELISGHEKRSTGYETIKHNSKMGPTLSWVVYGIVPGLNLYFLWRLATIITEHSIITNKKELLQEPKQNNN